MARLSSASAYTELHQATNRTFDPYMPIVVFGALFGGAALVALSSGAGSLSGGLAIAGICGYAAVLAIGAAHERENQKGHRSMVRSSSA